MSTTSLHPDYPKTADRTPSLRQSRKVLSQEYITKMARLSRSAGCTMFILVLALYSLVTASETGAEDVVVPTWWSGREDFATEDLIGFFLRVLPMRIRMRPADTLAEFLRKVRLSALEVYEHSAISTMSLIEAVPEAAVAFADPEYVWSIFQVMYGPGQGDLTMIDGTWRRQLFEDNSEWADDILDSFAQDLNFRIVIEEDAVRINATYDASLFQVESIETMTSRFVSLLAWATDGELPRATVGDVLAGLRGDSLAVGIPPAPANRIVE